jgi:hypothetical protein
MPTKSELIDEKGKNLRKGYLIWLIVFFTAWLGWATIKTFDLPFVSLELIFVILLVFSVCVQAFYALRERLLKISMKQDPQLRGLLNDELVQYNQLKAWRNAFIALVLYLILMATISLWISLGELHLLVITGLLLGFGTYNASAYLLNK